ncbi:hypothetical protein NPIL_443071 [Nephila pilipes]|uniref:Uncharacterized protein n=1 Tax=Nephila pilipes TaxID=299642 RepID=A0A8X6NMR1_NEPPI|nr:hypothetical protein NPIL_443071 [Nephila pilipes]
MKDRRLPPDENAALAKEFSAKRPERVGATNLLSSRGESDGPFGKSNEQPPESCLFPASQPPQLREWRVRAAIPALYCQIAADVNVQCFGPCGFPDCKSSHFARGFCKIINRCGSLLSIRLHIICSCLRLIANRPCKRCPFAGNLLCCSDFMLRPMPSRLACKCD